MSTSQEQHISVQDLQPGMFLHYEGKWWYVVTSPKHTKVSSWFTLAVIGAEGELRKQFRLRALTVSASFAIPESFSLKALAERIARRERRIELWHQEIVNLRALQLRLSDRSQEEEGNS